MTPNSHLLYGRRLTVKMTGEMLDRLDRQAEARELSRAALVRLALGRWLTVAEKTAA